MFDLLKNSGPVGSAIECSRIAMQQVFEVRNSQEFFEVAKQITVHEGRFKRVRGWTDLPIDWCRSNGGPRPLWIVGPVCCSLGPCFFR